MQHFQKKQSIDDSHRGTIIIIAGAGPIHSTVQALSRIRKECVLFGSPPHQTAAILTCSRLWFGGKVFSLDFPWPFFGSGAAPGGSGPDLIDAHRQAGPFETDSGGTSGSEFGGKSRSKFRCSDFLPGDSNYCLPLLGGGGVRVQGPMLGQRRTISTSRRR